VVLGLELRAYTLRHSTSLCVCVCVCVCVCLANSLPKLASNLDPPDLCLLSS
jgi:hypothetical protein